MEQKQILKLEGLKKPEYQVFEINGMKLDYFVTVNSHVFSKNKSLN